MTPPISLEQRQAIYDVYYKERNYFGRDRLYQLLKSRGIENISKMQVMDWLKEQELWQLYRKKEKAKTIQKTILTAPNKQIGIDLIDMQNYEYKGHKYIMTAIDLFSKKAYAVALKNKENKEVVRGLAKIIKSVDGEISSIRSDNGSEFISAQFKSLLDKHDIKHVFSLPYKPQSNGQVERFNGILKKMLFKSLKYESSYDWVSILQEILDNYNNSQHETTKFAPNDITEDDYSVVNNNIKNKVTSKRESNKSHLNVGDKVRIQVQDEKDGTNWSKDIYVIEKVYKPRKTITRQFYYLDNNDGKKYYDNDLQKIETIDNAFDTIEKFEISRLIKPTFKYNEPAFYVKWLHYKEPSIERRSKLIDDAPKLVKNYEKKHKVVWLSDRFTMNK